MPQLLPPQDPVLPLAPTHYSKEQQDQLGRTLRVYCTQVNSVLQQVLLGFNNYATFCDTTTQSPAVANTAYPVTFDTAVDAYGIARSSTDTSKILASRNGVYNFSFSAQLDTIGVGATTVYLWFRKNGTDLANTASKVVISGPNAELRVAWNYLLSFRAGDSFQLMWSATTTDARLLAATAAAPVPAIPSVILTVTYVYPSAAIL